MMKVSRVFGVLVLGSLVLASWSLLSLSDPRSTGDVLKATDPRLVSIDPLPEMLPGQVCLDPSGNLLMAASLNSLWAAPLPEAQSNRPRNPIRVIHDRYSSFSSVAVDRVRDEVVVTDENLFQVLVYNRTDNTPPTAAMTEPKRIISGLRTEIEFQCGVYIDEASGDIYAVNNDTVDKLVVFDREAKGNVPPSRYIEAPHGAFGITADEERGEIFLTIQHDSAITVLSKTGGQGQSPLRLIQGARTRLADPHGIALDTKRELLFVANFGSNHLVDPNAGGENPRGGGRGKENWPLSRSYAVRGSGKFNGPSINVYARDAHGDVPPLRVIAGSRTRLNWPTGVAVHSERGEVFVTNDTDSSILIFDVEAEGNVAPIRVVKGPSTGLNNPTGIFLDTQYNELWVANFGGHSLTVYPITAEGDTAPIRTIRSAPTSEESLMIGNPGAVDFDTKRAEILVPN